MTELNEIQSPLITHTHALLALLRVHAVLGELKTLADRHHWLQVADKLNLVRPVSLFLTLPSARNMMALCALKHTEYSHRQTIYLDWKSYHPTLLKKTIITHEAQLHDN